MNEHLSSSQMLFPAHLFSITGCGYTATVSKSHACYLQPSDFLITVSNIYACTALLYDGDSHVWMTIVVVRTLHLNVSFLCKQHTFMYSYTLRPSIPPPPFLPPTLSSNMLAAFFFFRKLGVSLISPL